MKLNYAPQAGLRRRPPERRRQSLAFWGGIAILVAFELVLMAKSWSPASDRPDLRLSSADQDSWPQEVRGDGGG